MKVMLSDAGALGASRPVTLHERYFRVMQVVAACWTLVGAVTMAFWLNAPKTSEMYRTMKFVTAGCLFVALGINSVVIPMYYVAKRYGADAERS
jgi:hypothetical protein